MKKRAVLLINIGTPESPAPGDVRKYLREFLSDPDVIDIPWVLRQILLYGFILPLRTPRSAKAYQKIWQEEGSPLLIHTKNFSRKLQELLGTGYQVTFAMRYGKPSIAEVATKLAKSEPEKIIVFPLYPQYSQAATDSSVKAVFKTLRRAGNTRPVKIIPPFYDDNGFIESFAAMAGDFAKPSATKHVLFSFHGLPKKHIKKNEVKKNYCFKEKDTCCAAVTRDNQYCYRAQCFKTARLIAEKLGIKEEDFSVSFQSRLTRGWIKPFTDEKIFTLLRSGKKDLVIFCPSFVADCLETLEEVNMGLREKFLAKGGRSFVLAPSLNDAGIWVESAGRLIKEAETTRRTTGVS